MYLSAHKINLLSRTMAVLAEPQHGPALRLRVGALMLELLDAQHYASYVWDAARGCFDQGVHLNMDNSNLRQYEAYYQYNDPITFELQQHRRAVRVTDVMPQQELQRTEFFNDFLARDGLHWGLNLYAWDGQLNIGDMRIWRDRRRENFNAEELQLLDLIGPGLLAALHRCEQQPSGGGLRAGAEAAATLSPREREIAGLATSGLSDKEIARRLGISPTTVRTHIEHAFQKLGVNSRVALARLLG